MKHPGLVVGVVVVALVLVGFIYATTDIIEGFLGYGGPKGFSATLNKSTTNLTANFTAAVVGGTAPFGYIWDFGDGVTRITSTPTVVYTYAAAGTYTVKVLVRDYSDRIVEASTTVTVTG